jgi:hypothetical protein
VPMSMSCTNSNHLKYRSFCPGMLPCIGAVTSNSYCYLLPKAVVYSVISLPMGSRLKPKACVCPMTLSCFQSATIWRLLLSSSSSYAVSYSEALVWLLCCADLQLWTCGDYVITDSAYQLHQVTVRDLSLLTRFLQRTGIASSATPEQDAGRNACLHAHRLQPLLWIACSLYLTAACLLTRRTLAQHSGGGFCGVIVSPVSSHAMCTPWLRA